MSDYHLLGLVLVPVVGIVIAFFIVFLCKGLDICLPSGPGPYAHLATDAVPPGRAAREQRLRDKECEAQGGALFATTTSGVAPVLPPMAPRTVPQQWAAAEPVAPRAPVPPAAPRAPVAPGAPRTRSSMAQMIPMEIMAERAPMPPQGPLTPLHLLGRDQS